MKKESRQFLDLFYNEGEHICISHDGYGYHSVSQEALEGTVSQISPNEKVDIKEITEEDVVLASINPVKGYRRDANVTAYRGFLVEMDDGTLEEQHKYIKESGLPFSICVFSGNKSLHYGIVLDEDLPSYEIWRDIAEWILNILDKADPMTKNPTRSIRFPGSIRKDGKGQEQKLVELRTRISADELAVWLNRYPDKNPATIRLSKMKERDTTSTVNGVPGWVFDKLQNGIDESRGRNNEWFAIAMELAKAGYDDEEMISYAEQFFTPDRDFTEGEWKSIMRYAYRRAQRV